MNQIYKVSRQETLVGTTPNTFVQPSRTSIAPVRGSKVEADNIRITYNEGKGDPFAEVTIMGANYVVGGLNANDLGLIKAENGRGRRVGVSFEGVVTADQVEGRLVIRPRGEVELSAAQYGRPRLPG